MQQVDPLPETAFLAVGQSPGPRAPRSASYRGHWRSLTVGRQAHWLVLSNQVSNFHHGQPRTLVDNGGHYARGQACDGPGSLARYLGSGRRGRQHLLLMIRGPGPDSVGPPYWSRV